MSLAVITSVLTSALLLTATPISVTVKPLGFSAQSDGEQVTVTQVKKGGVADKAGLTKGMRIVRIDWPRRKFARGPIAQLNETDLHDALLPTWDEPLRLRVKVGEKEKGLIFYWTDPAPTEEFPVIPLPPAQFERLTQGQKARYFMRLAAHNQPPPPEPKLELEQETSAHVVRGALKAMVGGGFTSDWVYVRATLTADCRKPLEKVVLRGTTPGLPRTFTPTPNSHILNPRFTADLPLWKPSAVTQACASKSPSLEVQLSGDMFCEGVPVQTTKFTARLSVVCEQELTPSVRASLDKLSMRVRNPPEKDTLPPETLMVGGKGKLELGAYVDDVIPLPSKATVVELDDKGAVSRRLEAKVAKVYSEQRFHVVLDTKEPRALRLALEVQFPDGSVQLGPPLNVEVVTPEQVTERRRRIEGAYEAMQSFERKFHDAWKDPCEKLPSTMEWLKAQPEIEWASAEERGHSFSYKVKGTLAPLIFSCHTP